MSINDVPPANEFVLLNGKRIKNIVELGRELKQMPADVFSHHVTREKNDFANWIEACVKDVPLGTLVRMTKERERMAAIIERRIQEMTRPPIMKPVVRKVEQTIAEPTIIRTRNVTRLTLTHNPPAAKTEKAAPLAPERHVIHSPHKTQLKLFHQPPKTEIYVHEVNKHHHGAALLIAHLVLGIVVGVAIAALVMMFYA